MSSDMSVYQADVQHMIARALRHPASTRHDEQLPRGSSEGADPACGWAAQAHRSASPAVAMESWPAQNGQIAKYWDNAVRSVDSTAIPARTLEFAWGLGRPPPSRTLATTIPTAQHAGVSTRASTAWQAGRQVWSCSHHQKATVSHLAGLCCDNVLGLLHQWAKMKCMRMHCLRGWAATATSKDHCCLRCHCAAAPLCL